MSYLNFLFLIFLLFFTTILVIFLIVSYKTKTRDFPFIKRDSLLTDAEKKFYFVLFEIIGNEYIIFSKVRIVDLLYLPKMNTSDFYHYQNKIQSKHVDFLICDKEGIEPLLVIELDDSSHLKVDRILRDRLVDKIFETARLPILHTKTAVNYDKLSLLNDVRKCINN